MAPDTGRHDADENHNDRARVDYLAGADDVELDATDQAELDELRALLADPTLWSEPPAELEDSVVALIAAEAGATTSSAPSASPDSAAPTAPRHRRIDSSDGGIVRAAPFPPAEREH